MVIFMRQFYVSNSKFIECYEMRGEINVKEFRMIVMAIVSSLSVSHVSLLAGDENQT
jgi:hypothetical protein